MSDPVVTARALRLVLAELQADSQDFTLTLNEFADCEGCLREVVQELAAWAAAYIIVDRDGTGAAACSGALDFVTDMLADALDAVGEP
jgi:hypothetical protein